MRLKEQNLRGGGGGRDGGRLKLPLLLYKEVKRLLLQLIINWFKANFRNMKFVQESKYKFTPKNA